MNRREALKAAGGIIIAHKTALLGFDFKPRPEYVIFFDRKLMGKDFAETAHGFPPNTVFYPVDVPPGKTLDDAIRIFEESRPE